MSITDRICNATHRNSELLLILTETQHANRDLDKQKARVARFDEKLSQIHHRIGQLDEKRASDLKRHKSYRDSVVKKFAYRLSGQSDEFAARAQKEQQEYYDVLQHEQQAKEEQDRIIADMVEALEVQQSLEEVVNQRTAAQDELDALYDSIFHGPTPEFPEEDELENKAENALNTYHCAALKAEIDAKFMETLTAARDRSDRALKDIMEALSGGHLASTTVEKKKLDNADIRLKEMRDLVAEAQKISPKVIALPTVDINIKLLDGEAYNNPWGRMALHDRIREWRSGAQVCLSELNAQLETATSIHNEIQENVKHKFKILNACKEALQVCRSEVFAIVASAESITRDGESPPPY